MYWSIAALRFAVTPQYISSGAIRLAPAPVGRVTALFTSIRSQRSGFMKSVKHSITHASGLNYSELNGTRMLTGRHCHMYINLFVARLHLLSLGCSPPTKSLLGLFGALVQSGRANNIFPLFDVALNPHLFFYYSNILSRCGLLISSCVSSPSFPLRWQCPPLLFLALRLSETLRSTQDRTPIHRHP